MSFDELCYYMMIRDEKAASYQEGYQEGHEAVAKEAACSLAQDGYAFDQIVRWVREPAETVRQWLEEAGIPVDADT